MMEEFEDGEAPPAEELTPCNICGRSFFPKVLKKHTPICQKAAVKKRKTFDSSRQRAEGTDIPTLKPIKAKPAAPPKKPSNWRRKHEDFIATIRAAKGITQVIKEGGPLPPPPPPSYDPDYIQCPHCQRRFGENAAERHIKFCREKAARMPKGKVVVAEVKKTPPRTQSKLSAPVKKASVMVSPASAVQSASSRLPQRSGSGQISGIPSSKPSSGIARSIPSGLASPPSGVGMKTRPVGSGYGPAKNAASSGLYRRKADSSNSRHDFVDNDVDGGAKGSFCNDCGTKYPVETAKFCCECGVRRMCM